MAAFLLTKYEENFAFATTPKGQNMIYLGLGSNLKDCDGNEPADVLLFALDALTENGVRIHTVSPFYESAPVPATADLPWFVNAVIAVETAMDKVDFMGLLLDIEAEFGRYRVKEKDVNNPQSRPLDIDIIDWHGLVREANAYSNLELPHPRMHDRAFVLMPLQDIAPDWQHPVTGKHILDLVAALPDQEIRILDID